MVSQISCIPLDFMEQSGEKLFSRTICSNHCLYHCYIQVDHRWIWVHGPESTPLMYRGIDMTWLENLLFSGVYTITDNFSERMTSVCLCNVLLFWMYFRDSLCVLTVDVCWLLFVILMHVRNFASVEVVNKALLTYLLRRFTDALLGDVCL